MLDSYNRSINYLRISVTDHCNLRCEYCMPSGKVKYMPYKELITADEIVETAKKAIAAGVDKVRITGGEPLVRPDIVTIIKRIAAIDGLRDLAITTNGILLTGLAKPLAQAGLMRVNISMDSVNHEQYKAITRVGDLQKVFDGIDAAREAGLSPIKINCVVKESANEPNAKAVKAFCEANGLQARFIREMDLATGKFWQVDGGQGGDCKTCNRLRLTANGKLKPCLFSNLEFDIRKLGIDKGLQKAVEQKPRSGSINKNNGFSNIGG